MPITQGTYQVNTGRDISVVLVTPFGNVSISSDNITSFDASQVVASLDVARIDGVNLPFAIPKMWQGSIEIDRGSEDLDELFGSLEAEWYANGNLPVCTLYTYVTEADGSITTSQYNNATITFSDAGRWQSDQVVKTKIDWRCSQRQIIG